MRVALYVRCSTQDQSVEAQLDGLREFAQARRLEIVAEYWDEGVSGAKPKRPALDELLADAHRRRFDAVLVWKLDRLGRSLSHLLRLVEQFEGQGIDLISLGDPGMDTTSPPQGKLIFSVIGAVAEFERDLIRERTRAGMAAACRRGKHLGRPRKRLDYLTLERLVGEGKSISAIARELGGSRSVVRRELSERVSPAGRDSPLESRAGQALQTLS